MQQLIKRLRLPFCLVAAPTILMTPVLPALLLGAETASAATAQIHGHGGLVGDYASEVTASGTSYQAIRFPLSLTLEGKASSRVSLFLNISPSFNLFPQQAAELGNASDLDRTSEKRQTGGETTQPLSSGFRSAEVLKSAYAYLSYSSEIGLLTLGRAPRHWGLGLWKNAEWRPDAGAISTSDLVNLTLDFSTSLSGSIAFEKMNEGFPTVAGDDGEAFTIEALLADDPRDPNSSGLAKRIGVSFSSYKHGRTETELSILDMFGQFYLSRFLIESEILYPTGNTRSLAYSLAGGDAAKCEDARNPDGDDVSCERKTIEGFAALLRTRYLIAGGESTDGQSWSSMANVLAARKESSTNVTPESHELGLELGFSRGDSDSFVGATKDQTITGIGFHPNIRPSLILFGSYQPVTPGFPGAIVQNVYYSRFSYAYETPGFGYISPAVIWARLHKVAAGDLQGTPGRDPNLGIELNVDYIYRTTSRIDFGLSAGALFPGKAYTVKLDTGDKDAKVSYGIRSSVSTSF